MATMLDIIGSMVIRGAILLMLLNLSVQMNTATYQKTAFTAMRQSTAISAQILYDDLYLAKNIDTARSYKIVFSAVDSNGSTVPAKCYLESQSDTLKNLYRSVNGHATMIAHNVDSLELRYYDKDGLLINPVTGDITKIRSIHCQLWFLTDDRSRLVFWEKQVFPPNLYL